MSTGRCRWVRFVLLLSPFWLSGLGCSSAQTSNTARTATEQLLISNAVDYSLDKVDFTAVYGRKVYFEEKYIDCVDKNYVIASVRHRIFKAGGMLVAKPDDADMVLEMRTGTVGTNTSESFVGVPEITLPGLLTLPEVRFIERKMQRGTAKLGLVAYDPRTGQILGNGGMSLAQSDDSNWYVIGVGPFQSGTVRNELQRGTTGNAGLVRNQIPPMVAFAPPDYPPPIPASLVPPPIEYVSEPGAAAVAPASGSDGDRDDAVPLESLESR